MVKFSVCISILLFGIVDSRYGEPCSSRLDCPSDPYLRKYSCRDGICQCDSIYEVLYSKSGVPTCEFYFSKHYLFGTCDSSCGDREECVRSECRCKSDHVRGADKQCYHVHHVMPFQKCSLDSHSNTAHICNTKHFSFCNSGTCVCFSKYFYNSSSEVCEHKNKFIDAMKISSYSVTVGEYCLKDSDCFDGLSCKKNYTCQCPGFCTYEKEKEGCDCGELEFQIPAVVIAVGIIFGFAFAICWCYIIKKTITKHKKKNHGMTLQDLHEEPGNDTEEVSESVNSPSKDSAPIDNPPSYSSLLPGHTQSSPPPYSTTHAPSSVPYPIQIAPYPTDSSPYPQGSTYPTDSSSYTQGSTYLTDSSSNPQGSSYQTDSLPRLQGLPYSTDSSQYPQGTPYPASTISSTPYSVNHPSNQEAPPFPSAPLAFEGVPNPTMQQNMPLK